MANPELISLHEEQDRKIKLAEDAVSTAKVKLEAAESKLKNLQDLKAALPDPPKTRTSQATSDSPVGSTPK